MGGNLFSFLGTNLETDISIWQRFFPFLTSFTVAVPYDWISSNYEVWQKVLEGERLPKPEFMSQILYNLLRKCSDSLPENRPDFGEIVDQLRITKSKPRDFTKGLF